MIFVTGDCHSDVRRFSTEYFPEQKNMTKEDTVIILGDFGMVWDYQETRHPHNESGEEKFWLDWLEEKPFTTVFVDGNHENFDRLCTYPEKKWHGGMVHEIRPSVLHLKRGEVFEIEGKRFFAFGGASSHDMEDGLLDGSDPHWKEQARALVARGKRCFRIKGVSWWPQELPSKEEMEHGLENLKNHDFKVDFVLSHCAPTFVQAFMSAGAYKRDVLTDYFQSLFYDHGLTFDTWFFGHYHDNRPVLDKFVLLYEQIGQLNLQPERYLEENDKEEK